MTTNDNDLNAHEKAVTVYDALLKGQTPTTREIADNLGITYQGAAKLMDGISRVAPVTQDNSRWKIFNHT